MRRGKSRIAILALLSGVLLCTLLGPEVGAQDKIKVPVMMHWWLEPGTQRFFTEAKAAFEKEYPNIEIEPVPVPYDQLYNQELTKLPTSSPPGIIYSWVGNVDTFIATGLLAPLDKYVAASGIQKRFTKSALDYARDSHGTLYALPTQMTCEALIYNEQLLKEKGVRVPTSLGGLHEAAKKLSDPSKRRYGFGLLTSGSRLYSKFWFFVTALGGKLAQNGSPTVNAPEVVKALELYREYVKSGLTPVGTSESVLREMYANGSIAMMVDVPTLLTIVKEANPTVYAHSKVALLPTKGHRGSSLVVTYFSIPKNFRYKDEAWKFLEFISKPEWVDRFIDYVNSTHASRQPVPKSIAARYPWMQMFSNQKQYAEPNFPEGLAEYSKEFQAMLLDYLQEAINSQEPASAILNRAQVKFAEWAKAKKQ